MCQCFNDVEVDESKVDELVSAAFSAGGLGGQTEGKEARAAIRGIYDKMCAAGSKMEGAKGAVYAIRECMDGAFVQHLGPQSNVGVLFANQASNRWKAAMKEYLKDLIDELPKVVSTITTSMDEPADKEERASLRTLRWCVAKVKVLSAIFSMRKREHSYPILPFMSRSVYTHIVTHLEVIDASLKEVSSRSYRASLSVPCFERGQRPPVSRISGGARNARYRPTGSTLVSRISGGARNARNGHHARTHHHIAAMRYRAFRGGMKMRDTRSLNYLPSRSMLTISVHSSVGGGSR